MSTFTLSLLGNFSPKSWLCGLGFHKWITYSTVEVSTSKENVTVYQHWLECTRCGKLTLKREEIYE